MRPPPADAAPTAGAPTRPARASRIAYQPALDGLRAMAILTIMLYHGEVSWPRGGYLSVDLFFVLSGYLITTLLLAEWEARATIDLKRFWSGRARRLLPALFLMLGGIAAYAALLAPATGLARMRGDALATLLYVAISSERVHLHGAWLLALRMAATFVAAILSYRLVELPIRRGALRRRRLARPVTVGVAVAIVALLAVTTAPGRVPVAEGVALSGATGAAGLPTVTPSPTTATPSPGQPASRPNPGNAFRVYLVGDSVGFTLGFYYPRGTVRGMILGGDTELGCGLVRAPIVLAGSVQPVDPKCTTWPTRWRDKTAAFHPDVTLMMLGGWEVLDHQVDGRVLEPATPEYEQYLDSELQLAYDLVAPSSRRIAMLNVPCYHQPDTGLDKSL